jgi:hypothetical protein
MLNGASFFRTVKRGKHTLINASFNDINKAIENKECQEKPLEEVFPKQYHELLPLFGTVLADKLPPHRRNVDHGVGLKEGETPSRGPLYKMSRQELIVMKEWLEDNMTKEFIRQSSSLYTAPCLCAKKTGWWASILY